MGEAMRAKTPIRDEQGKIIGVVSLGYLISKIDHFPAAGLPPATHPLFSHCAGGITHNLLSMTF